MPTEASTIHPDPLIEALNLGKCHYNDREYDRAIACFSNVINKNRTYSDALLHRAKAYTNGGYYAMAYSDFREWFKENPDHIIANSWVYFGYTLFKLGEFKEAIKVYTLALKLEIDQKNREHSLIYRGESYYQTKDLPRALSDLTTASRETKDFQLDYRLRIAQIHLKQNQYQLVLTMLETIAESSLSNDSLIEFLSLRHEAYMGLKNAERALSDIQQLMQLDPNRKQHYEKLSHFINGKNIAKNGNMTYKSTLTGSSVELDDLVFEPADAMPKNGKNACTRFFKTPSENSARFVVKKVTQAHASKKTHVDAQYRNEAVAWNTMNPHSPSFFFEFPHASCRLVLPKIPGTLLKIMNLDSTGKIIEYLQIWLGIGLELNHLHQLNWVHGDLKQDNIILNFDQEAGYYQTTLIDFGLSEPVGAPYGGYPGIKAVHIAPELYGKNKIASAYSADVYSFSAEIQRCCNFNLHSHILDIFVYLGCAEKPSTRPSLEKLLVILWGQLIDLISTNDNHKIQLSIGISSVQFIANFISHLRPLRFMALMNITNQLDAKQHEQLRRHSIIVEAIINTHALHEGNLPSANGFIQELLKSNNEGSDKAAHMDM